MVQLPRPSVAPAASAEVPDKIGKYPIIKVAGKGTTGTIYLSHDPYFRRDVAIKVYTTSTDDDPQRARIARKMFFNEAHMVGMLQHPNILPIYDAGEEDGKYYVVMEHVQRARTLEAYCRPDNLLHIEDVVKIIYKCAKALHYAHKRGVIHRDIKPSNIMLTNDNDVRIIDFGIAILLDADISRIEGIAGSPSYMSPEQVQGFDITPASDLYSLGAVMYELLTGFRPFRGSSLSKLLNQIVYATPPPIHTLRLGVPDELEEVVAIALQKDPARRYANGGEFGARLTRVYQQLKAQWDGIDRHEHFDEPQGQQDREESEGRLRRRVPGQPPLSLLRSQGRRRRLQRRVGRVPLDRRRRDRPCARPPRVPRGRRAIRPPACRSARHEAEPQGLDRRRDPRVHRHVPGHGQAGARRRLHARSPTGSRRSPRPSVRTPTASRRRSTRCDPWATDAGAPPRNAAALPATAPVSTRPRPAWPAPPARCAPGRRPRTACRTQRSMSSSQIPGGARAASRRRPGIRSTGRTPAFYDEAALDKELERVFDICHGCRRCFSLCNAFPTLFDAIDAGTTGELDGVDKKVLPGRRGSLLPL
jgi:serine/threonine protein kinase